LEEGLLALADRAVAGLMIFFAALVPDKTLSAVFLWPEMRLFFRRWSLMPYVQILRETIQER
jgi:hypothetical protein